MVGFIKEVFTSIQGEGVRVGQRQIFIRFLGCNLSCNYCDVPDCQKTEGSFIFENKIYNNPVKLDFLVDKITEKEVAITGGEPLLQKDFLEVLCIRLKDRGKKLYLDTNGTLPKELNRIVRYLDYIALDFKIPTATGRPQHWKEHEKCLKIASKKDVFVKMVINENLLPRELDSVYSIIEKVDKKIPLVIQPIFGQTIPNILEIQRQALKRLKDVRIIPQVHKYLYLK